MPTYVRTDKCEGCRGQDRPHDLMTLDMGASQTGHAMKAWNHEPELCLD